MKREEVKNKIPGITDEQLDWLMGENVRDVTAEKTKAASLQTLNDGIMTKDLCGLAEGITPTAVDSEGFIKAIRTRLEAKLA